MFRGLMDPARYLARAIRSCVLGVRRWRRARVAARILEALDPYGANRELRQFLAGFVGVDVAHWAPMMPRSTEKP